jgi:hypothetical protein
MAAEAIPVTEYLRWRDEFASAMDERLYTIEYLDRLIEQMQAQIWFGERAAMVTEVRSYPAGAHVIHGLVAAGELEEIRDVLIPRAEAWARLAGCQMAVIESRPGWAKALKASGYEPHQVAVRKDL